MGTDEGKWTLKSAIANIQRNGGGVDPFANVVTHPQPGIKLWGVIDYLCNTHNFTHRRERLKQKGVTKFKPAKKTLVEIKRKPKHKECD